MSDEDLVKIVVDLPNHWATGGEGLWARRLGHDEYDRQRSLLRIRSELSRRRARHKLRSSLKPQIEEVLRRSGHRTLRIIFLNKTPEDQQQPYLEQIKRFGASLERAHATTWRSTFPLAVDTTIWPNISHLSSTAVF